jgi:hypothetical protein
MWTLAIDHEVVVAQLPQLPQRLNTPPPHLELDPLQQAINTPKTLPQFKSLQKDVGTIVTDAVFGAQPITPSKLPKIIKLIKAGEKGFVHSNLLQQQIDTLHKAYRDRLKRKSNKKFHIQKGGVVRVQYALDNLG